MPIDKETETGLSETEKAVFLGMAQKFDEDPDLLTLDTKELTAKFPGTSHSRWRDFLALDAVALYAQHITRSNMAIAFRKAQKALTTEAAGGNTQAAKQITDLSNFLANNQNKVVHILTYVPRHEINRNRPQVGDTEGDDLPEMETELAAGENITN